MKLTPRFSLIVSSIFIFFTFISCGVDQEFLLDTVLDQEEPPQPGDDSGDEDEPKEDINDAGEPEDFPNTDDEGALEINTDPCDYDLSSATANGTLSIDCTIDLNGSTVELPSEVTLEYNGGQLINGNVVFTGGKIDGRLLNQYLTVEGNVTLIDPVFFFYPERWDVQQGSVNYDRALANRYNLEEVMELAKSLGGDTFQIDKFDAFFEITKVTSTSNLNFYPSVEAVNVPGEFNLVMTDNTHLRVYPNSEEKYALLAVRDVRDVTITGGNLHGDRDEHDYSAGGSMEWGHLLDLHAAVNARVTGVRMSMALGDGMKIHSLRHTFEPNYAPSHNIYVSDCVFDNNRRNNLSITDGYDITIDNNTFLNASNDTPNSEGVAPGFGIDVEAYRRRGSDGEIIYYEIARDILISNNTERNSRKGAITVAIGYDVTIQGNRTEKSISYSTANGTRIVGNTVTAVTETARTSGTAIKAGRSSSDSPTIFDNKVYDNMVIGYNIAYNLGNDDVELYNNSAEDFKTGIYPVKLSNAKIYGNTLRSNRDNSHGVFVFSTDISDVEFYNNTIEISDGNPYKFTAVNEGMNSPLDANVIVRNENLSSPDNTVHFNRANGIQFLDNELDHGMEIFSSNDLIISNNSINTVGYNDHGIYLREVNNDITINSNSISVDASKNCIEIQSSTNTSEVSTSNNQCAN